MRPTVATASLPVSLQRVVEHVQHHLSDPLPLPQLAELAGLSQWRLMSVFRQHLGVPPHRYINQQRVGRAKALLHQGMSAVAVAGACGFYDQSHLSRHFKNLCGMTPGQYTQSEPRRAQRP
jgi:transcriptional regulator GlxA family with amidase domain